MITSFEVGAIFKIVNEASPALTKILRQVRELQAAIDKAKESLALIGKMPGVGVAETGDLAKAWGDVAKNAGAARLAITQASSASARAALPAPVGRPGGTGGGGGGRHRPGWLGGAHITGPGVPIAGGGHIRFGGPGMAAAGALGWGVYQAAETEDIVWQLTRHAGLQQTEASHARFRKIIQDAQIRDGFNLKQVGEAALQDIRMMQGTPGGGLDALPEMLHIAAVEARSKGSPLSESMTANVGFAHHAFCQAAVVQKFRGDDDRIAVRRKLNL